MKVAVLLSGGVDSSVALHLIQRDADRPHEITAFYLKIWLEDDLAFLGDCPWEEDLSHARAVCEQAGVPLRVVPLQTEYNDSIVSHALAELRRGRTPSPDILCNERIKFGLFLKTIDPDFDRVASGHYAQIIRRDDDPDGTCRLKRSPDPVKDQTYFLSSLNQDQLRRLWFPIGHLTKPEVRRLARSLRLPNRDRRDSQGICFLGKIQYTDFVRFHLGESTGDIIDLDSGRRLATHRGVWFHTVGQRRGLGLSGGPWFVVSKDLEKNRLYVSHAFRYLEHARREFVAGPVRWIGLEPSSRSLTTKIRHTPQLDPCEIEPIGNDRWKVTLERKDPGIAPGQSAIFYDGEFCLGGGTIEATEKQIDAE